MKKWDEYVDLRPGPELAQLAGFAVEEPLALSGLLPADPAGLRARGGPRALVQEAYDLLRAKQVAYRSELLDQSGYQVVRPWSRVQREGGTCLDLALLTCAQLLACDLRAFLVLSYGSDNHAMVLVDLVAASTDAARRPTGTPAFTGIDDDAVEWEVDRWRTDGWLLVDPTSACGGGALDLEGSAREAHHVVHAADRVWLVDVLRGRDRHGQRSLPAPDVPGLLSQRCGPVPSLVPVPERLGLRHRLVERAGTTVLVGPRGAGKSALGLELVHRATRGGGWRLNGSSAQALRSSLAEQEGLERGLPAEVVATDVDGFARAALGRLAAITGPWVVVVDDADGLPSEIEDLLPTPRIGAGQRLVVTTAQASDVAAAAATAATADDGRVPDSRDEDATKGSWLAWADRRPSTRCEHVGPLSRDDADAFLASAGHTLTATQLADPAVRTPLMLRALGALAARGIDVEPSSAPSPQAAYWAALSPELPLHERHLAYTLALLPGRAVPADLLAGLAVGADLQALADAGLVTRVGHEWHLHGTLADAIRGDEGFAPAAPGLALALLEVPATQRHLRVAYDKAAVQRLQHALADAALPDPAAVTAIARLAAVVDERGTASDAARLAQLGLDRGAEDDVRATFLLGVARWPNQHPAAAAEAHGRTVLAELDVAVGHTEEARRVARDHELRLTATAMLGLLTQKRAVMRTRHREVASRAQAAEDVRTGLQRRAAAVRAEVTVHSDERTTQMRAARDLIVEARNGRHSAPELLRAKSIFNICGVDLELAKDQPTERDALLDEAATAYRTVSELRRAVYGTEPHRHVAACTAGEGLVELYRVLLGGARPTEERDEENLCGALRAATKHSAQALVERQALETVDGEDVVKSLEVLAKTVLLRLAVAKGSFDAVLGPGGIAMALFDEVVQFAPDLLPEGLAAVVPPQPAPSPTAHATG